MCDFLKITKQKATLLMVAFCLYSTSILALEDNRLEKARTNLIEGKREVALSIMKNLIDESVDPKVKSEHLKEGDKIATYFVSEAGQKLYELGESMCETNSDLAREKYIESLKHEGKNLKILNSLSVLELNIGQCDEAKKWNEQAMSEYPYMAASRAIKLKISECTDGIESISKQIENIEQTDPIVNIPAVSVLIGRVLIQKGQMESGLKKLRGLTTPKHTFPDAWYWRWKLDPIEGALQREYLENYIKNCKSMTPRLKRKYRETGVVCLQLEEAEKTFKQSGAEPDESTVN